MSFNSDNSGSSSTSSSSSSAPMPVFQAPPATGDVPSFLKGQPTETTYRAMGGAGFQEEFSAVSSSPFGGAGSFAPAPMQFGSGAAPPQITTSWDAQSRLAAPTAAASFYDAQQQQHQLAKAKQLAGGLAAYDRPQAEADAWVNHAAPVHLTSTTISTPSTTTTTTTTPAALPIDEVNNGPQPMDYQSSQPALARVPSIALKATTATTADQVLKQVVDSFPSANVDYEVRVGPEFSVRAVVAAKDCTRSHVEARVFSNGDGALDFVAELSRTHGNASAFHTLVSHTFSALKHDPFFVSAVPTNGRADVAASLAAPEGPSGAMDDWSCKGIDETSARQLVEMCSSQFADVKLKALQTLASLSTSAVAQRQLRTSVQSALVDTLANASFYPDEEIKWLVASIALNMAKDPSFASAKATQPLVASLFGFLDQEVCLANRDTQRLAARTLCFLVPVYKNILLHPKMGYFLTVLERHLASCDPTLQGSVQHIINHLLAQ